MVDRQCAQQRQDRLDEAAAVAAERDDPPRDLALDAGSVVGGGNAEEPAHDLHAWPIARAAAVRGGAAFQDQRVPARQCAQEFVREPRLADARIAHHCGDAALAIGGDLGEGVEQLLHFVLPANEGRDRARRQAVEARSRNRRATYFRDLDRALETLDLQRADGARLDVARGEAHRVGGRQDRSRCCHLLHA